jgi:hypothetical protein
MSLQDTINTTISVIQGCVDVAKSTISATASGIAYLFTNFPDVMKGAWEIFKGSLSLGQYLATLGLQGLKYTVLHIPEIMKGLYNVAREILEHFPEVAKFVGYTLPKFFLYDIPKTALKHIPAITNWFVKHTPDLIAHSVGVGVGILYAPFKISYDFLTGKNKQEARAQHHIDPITEAAFVGILGAAVVTEGFRKDVLDYEAREQRSIVSGYESQRKQPNASLERQEHKSLIEDTAALNAGRQSKHRS